MQHQYSGLREPITSDFVAATGCFAAVPASEQWPVNPSFQQLWITLHCSSSTYSSRNSRKYSRLTFTCGLMQQLRFLQHQLQQVRDLLHQRYCAATSLFFIQPVTVTVNPAPTVVAAVNPTFILLLR
jgi:hypothetical protein